MADDKKKPAEGGSSLGWLMPPAHPGFFFLWLFGVFMFMFFIWYITGGVERSENAPVFVQSPVAPIITDTSAPPLKDWHNVAFSNFSLNVPPGWYVVNPTQPENLVYRGGVTNGVTTISFEYGLYIKPDIDERDNRYQITKELVGPTNAKLFLPKKFGTKTVMLFDRYPYKESLMIFGISLTPETQATALTIMRSVRFVN